MLLSSVGCRAMITPLARRRFLVRFLLLPRPRSPTPPPRRPLVRWHHWTPKHTQPARASRFSLCHGRCSAVRFSLPHIFSVTPTIVTTATTRTTATATAGMASRAIERTITAPLSLSRARLPLIDRYETDGRTSSDDRDAAERAAPTEVSVVARTTRCSPRGGQCSLSLSFSLPVALSSSRS